MKIAQTLNIGQEAFDQQLPGSAGYTTANPGGAFGIMLSNIFSGLMTIAALMLLLYLVWGAISWITSGGDKAKVEHARGQITHAVIGILVLASTLAVFMLIQQFLGINVIKFGNAPTGGSSGANFQTPAFN